MRAEQVEQVANMAERYPGVNIVIDHIAMIDIAASEHPDSVLVAALLALVRALRACGCRLIRLVGAQPAVAEALRVIGVTRLLAA